MIIQQNTIIIAIATVVTSFLITAIAVPVMIKVAYRLNMLDHPGDRKQHDGSTPLLGGVAIFLGTIASILLFARSTDYSYVLLFCGGLLGVMLMGLMDDLYNMSAKIRLLILFAMATFVIFACIEVLYSGFGPQYSKLLYYFFICCMIFWTVSIANAINWCDGLDGLATTQTLISTATFAVIFFLQGRVDLLFPVALALTGALLGFLLYNYSPAKIFMGDAGSMFIGFLLGVLSLSSIMYTMSYEAIIIPVLILVVPIADMCIVILRRLLTNKNIMSADNQHFHHLLKLRFGTKKVVLIINAIQLFFSLLGIIIYVNELYLLGWIVFAVGVFACILFTLATLKLTNRINTDTEII